MKGHWGGFEAGTGLEYGGKTPIGKVTTVGSPPQEGTEGL